VPQTVNDGDSTYVLRHKIIQEVASSPASATIKTPDFTTKSGVFLTFYGYIETN
jgi:hypothetical protein